MTTAVKIPQQDYTHERLTEIADDSAPLKLWVFDANLQPTVAKTPAEINAQLPRIGARGDSSVGPVSKLIALLFRTNDGRQEEATVFVVGHGRFTVSIYNYASLLVSFNTMMATMESTEGMEKSLTLGAK